MANKFCTGCGAPLDENKKFCTECGAAVTENDLPAGDPVAVAPTPPVYTPPAAPVPTPAAPTAVPSPPVPAAPMAPPLAAADGKPAADSPYAPIGTGGWIGIMLLMVVPVVNLILLIIWACGGCKKITKRGFARAILIFMAISLVVGLVVGLVFRQAIGSALASFQDPSVGLTAGYGSQGDNAEPGAIDSLAGLLNQIGGQSANPAGGNGAVDPGSVDPGSVNPDDAAFAQAFAAAFLNEEMLRESGATEEEIAAFQAAMNGDRQTLRDMGYTEEEIDEAMAFFSGGFDFSSLAGALTE
ncbi:MAG: zinc ribbon domain-containing protein [Oscillospiraceae bacterium]|nr:zinc ribbon domain-containing protein [Oscillospiraceae bacterium]